MLENKGGNLILQQRRQSYSTGAVLFWYIITPGAEVFFSGLLLPPAALLQYYSWVITSLVAILFPSKIASPDGWAVWGVVVFTRWWLLVDHCVLRNWDRILVRAVKGLIYRAGMVSICPLLWQRDVKLQQTKPNPSKINHKECITCIKFIHNEWISAETNFI